jgi:hypothetical protein
MTPGRTTFELTIRDAGDPLAARTGHERDPEYRLRAVLKSLLRLHGFRAIRVTPTSTGKTNSPPKRP